MDSDQDLHKGLMVIKMQRLMWLHNFKLLWNSSSSHDIIEWNLQKIAVHNKKHCIRILNSAMLCGILMPEICAFQTSFMVSKCIQPLFKLICILIGQSPHFQADFFDYFPSLPLQDKHRLLADLLGVWKISTSANYVVLHAGCHAGPISSIYTVDTVSTYQPWWVIRFHGLNFSSVHCTPPC